MPVGSNVMRCNYRVYEGTVILKIKKSSSDYYIVIKSIFFIALYYINNCLNTVRWCNITTIRAITLLRIIFSHKIIVNFRILHSYFAENTMYSRRLGNFPFVDLLITMPFKNNTKHVVINKAANWHFQRRQLYTKQWGLQIY